MGWPDITSWSGRINGVKKWQGEFPCNKHAQIILKPGDTYTMKCHSWYGHCSSESTNLRLVPQ